MADKPTSDPLFGNKLAAAGLSALLLVFGLPQIAKALLGGGHGGGHGDDELHLAYCCVELETAKSDGGDAPVELDIGTLLASANPAGGERRSAVCKSCHSFEQGGPNGTGPNLWGIVGRQVAGVDGFGYSSALNEFGGEWTYERLDAYLKNSAEYIPGTAMNQRFPKPEQRADLLAYLATLAANPVPFPAPVAPAEEIKESALEAGEVEFADASAAKKK